ncbi:MAG: cupin [Actinomycetota bacterium]
MNLRDVELPERESYRGTSVREALGGERIGCTVYELEDGKELWPYHFHWNNDEWLLVVDGAPTLRTPAGERVLRAGNLVGFPEGESGAHALRGPGRVAIFSTLEQGSVTYPDSGKVGAGPPWDRLYFRRADAVDYWDGET